MQIVNGNEEEILDMLKEFGLCEYEARMYFTLLAIGRAKVGTATRKASVPQSRAYNVLENLMSKGFVEISREERPREYRAKALESVLKITIEEKQKEVGALENSYHELKKIVQAIAPIHGEYSGLRLFSPSYKRWCR
jgi:sugar-specific transcriptional regulator TrmB